MWKKVKSHWLLLVFAVALGSCSQAGKDKDIKGNLAVTAKEEIGFAGVKYVVADGVVHLSGFCPSEQMKMEVADQVEKLTGVKGVVNNIEVAPVVLTADLDLKQSVDSVLMDYARVQADVADSIVFLQGEVKREQAQNLLKAISSLNPKSIQSNVISN